MEEEKRSFEEQLKPIVEELNVIKEVERNYTGIFQKVRVELFRLRKRLGATKESHTP